MRLLPSALLLLALAAPGIPGAEPVEPRPISGSENRPVTALVLSGGGARGAAHIGVLKMLEEAQVPIDLVVGTSMGAIVGGLYASGLSPEQIESRLLGVDWREVYSDRPVRKNVPFRRKKDDGLPLFDFEMGVGSNFKFQPGLVAGQKFGFNLQTWTMHTAGIEDFDHLPIPFRAVATDLNAGEPYVLDRGNLGTAIRASIAVPSILAPVRVDGRVLVDGGLTSNLPIEIAQELGAERIIAVDISSPLKEVSKVSLFSVASQTLSIFSEQSLRQQRAALGPDDLLIVPDLEGVTATDFKIEVLRETIDRGAAATREHEETLARYSVPVSEFAAFTRHQRRDAELLVVEPMIDQTHVEGFSRVSPRRITSRIRSAPGTRLNLDRLREDLDRVYEIGEFLHVEFQLRRDIDDQTILVIHVDEKPWGPNYVRFGLGVISKVESQGNFSVLGQLTRAELNPRGGEWKSRVALGSSLELFSEFYQPLDWDGFFFLVPSVAYVQSEAFQTSATGGVDRIDFDLLSGAFDFGVQFRNFGEIRIGAAWGTGSIDVQDGLNQPPLDFDVAGWRTQINIDRFDSATFPRRGSLLNAGLFFSSETLGADQEYDLLEVFVAGAFSKGPNTVLIWLDGGSNLGSELPFFEGQDLGGFLNLSGLDSGTISGNVGGVLSTLYYRQVGFLAPALGGGIYVGGSVETGGAWERSADAAFDDLTWAGSLFVGADTRLGPLYFGYGRAETGDDAFYLFLGRLF